MEPKQKQHLVVDVTDDWSKVQCCEEQYCIGTWNVRSMNEGKQEMARVYIDILGSSELKWTGMGEFNSDDHYIYYCGQESLRRNKVILIVNKRVKYRTLVQSQKCQIDLSSLPRQTIQYHSNPSLCSNQKGWRSWSWMVLWRQDLLELTPKKDVRFIIEDWDAKVGSQETPVVTGKFGLRVQNEAG